MTPRPQLKPARKLAKNNGVRCPNESDDYRRARDALLAGEIELRQRGRCRYAGFQRVHPGRWHDPPLLERRDGRQHC